MRRSRVERSRPEVNMVPMIDCVFQLMIFFLVATQVKNAPEGMELPVARNGRTLEAEPSQLTLDVLGRDAGRPYRVAGRECDLAGLKALLREDAAYRRGIRREPPVLRVRADRGSRFIDIQQGLIACREVGIWQVRLATIKEARP